MTDPLISEAWFAAVSDVFADVQGLQRVYGVKDATTDAKVVPMAGELIDGPVGVLGYGGAQITPGSWERQRHTLNAAIWIPVSHNAVGQVHTQAIAFIDRVMDAFPPRAKAGGIHPELASVLVTGFEAIGQRSWGDPPQQRIYIALPFSIEVVRNRAAQYLPA